MGHEGHFGLRACPFFERLKAKLRGNDGHGQENSCPDSKYKLGLFLCILQMRQFIVTYSPLSVLKRAIFDTGHYHRMKYEPGITYIKSKW